MHISPTPDVKPNPSVELADKQTPGVTTYKVEFRHPEYLMAPPDSDAPLTRAEIERVLMTDPPATYQAPPFGSAQPMKRTGDADPDGDVFQPTSEERAEVDAWRLEAGTQ